MLTLRAVSDSSIRDGLYDIDGKQAHGTRKPIGVATMVRYVKNVNVWGQASCVLYSLDPPIQLFEYGHMTIAKFVVVVEVPATDNKPPITTVFASTRTGALFGRFSEQADYVAAEVGPRLVGSNSHRKVLNALQGGYVIDDIAWRERQIVKLQKK